MITFLVFFLFLSPSTDPVPYKHMDEFEVLVDYKFMERSAVDHNDATYHTRKEPTGLQPYLVLYLKMKKLQEKELRIRIVDSNGSIVLNRKVSENTSYKLVFGFTEDVKEGLLANRFSVSLLSQDKEPVSRIELVVEPDGTFLVNEQKRGKF